MDMPRIYGARWILCLPLLHSTDKNLVYGSHVFLTLIIRRSYLLGPRYKHLSIGLAQTIKCVVYSVARW